MAQLLRELSHGERAFFLGSVSICTMSQISGDIPAEVLQKAANLIVEANKLLRCEIVKSEQKYYFSPIQDFNFCIETKEIESPKNALLELEELTNTKVSSSAGLFDIKLLKISENKTSYLLTKMSHIISDGMSNTQLHNTLLDLCNQSIENNSSNIKREKSCLRNSGIPLPIEDYLIPRFDGLEVEDVVSEKKSHLLKAKTECLANQTVGMLSQVRIRPYTLSQEQTKQVLSWCKKEGVSVNNALISSLLLSANTLLPKKSNRLLVRQAVNLRKKVYPNIEDSEFITAATSILSPFSISEHETLSSLSRHVEKTSLQEMEYTSTLQNHIANKAINALGLPLTFHISNLGLLDIDSNFSSFRLEQLYMLPTANFGNTIPLVISTINSALNITCHADELTFPDHLLDKLIWGAIDKLCEVNKESISVVT